MTISPKAIYRFHASCCCSIAKLCLTLCDSMDCSTPGFPVLHYLWSFLKLMSIEWVMQFNHLILCRPRLLLPSIFPNESFFLFQWVGFLHLVAKVLELWFDLLAVQGILKSLLQHCNSKASILQHSAFFMVQLSHLYMVTGKSIALTIHTFVSKVMSWLFNTFSTFVMLSLQVTRVLIS